MPVLDSPAFFDWPLSPLGQKRYGYLVWLRLDPEASVRLLEDAEASRAAALLPRDWFLGFIIADGGAGQRTSEGKAALSFALALIGEGPPEPEGHSVPISPALQVPDDRVPLQLSSPLPWPNLYVHSQVMAGGIISRLHHGTGQFEPVLTEANISLVYHAIFADLTARQNAQAQAQRAAAGGDEYGSDSDAEGTDYDTNSDADIVEYDTRPVDDKFKRLRMHVELWLDPSSFPEPPTRPENWLDIGTRMSSIWNAWRDRGYEELKTRGARKAEAWLQSVQAGAPIPDDGNEIALDPRASDDAIVPEDAVDYRIEQEREARDPSPVSWPDDWPVNLSQPKHVVEHVSFHPPLMLPALAFTGDQAAPPSTVHHDPSSTRASAELTRGEWRRAMENARPSADVDVTGQRGERENEPGALLRGDDISPDDAVDDRMEQCRGEALGQRDTPSPAQQKVLHDREGTGSCSPRDTPGSAKPAAIPIVAPQVVDETAYPQVHGGRAVSASGKDFLRGAASVVRSLLARAKQRARSLRIAGAQLTGSQRFGRAPSK